MKKIAVALTAGVLVWLAAVALTPKMAGGDFFFVLPQFWILGFLLGGVVTIVLLSAFALGRGINASHFLAACAAYFLPACFAVVVGDTLSNLFAYPPARETLHADASIMLPLMYGLGLIFAWRLLLGRKKDFLVGFTLPPVVMVCVLLGFWANQVFASDAFVYRNAFSFGTVNVAYKDGVLKTTSTLTIKKPGDYTFSATPIPPEMNVDGGDQIPEIAWTQSKTAPVAPGEYGVVLTWRNVQLRDATTNPLVGGIRPYFQINRKVGDREQFLRSFKIPVAAPSRL